MKRLHYSYFAFIFALLVLFTAWPELSEAATPPVRRSYHHSHRRHTNNRKRYSRKKTTIPKDYIIRNSRRYKVW